MFSGCYSLNQLKINNFNTRKCTNMKWMFQKCSKKLKEKIRTKFKNIKKAAFEDY